MIIGAALVAVLSNVAVADEDIDLRGPKGWSNFFQIEGYDLNPRTKIMEVLIAPKKNCKDMTAFFGAENGGVVESSGGFFEVKDTQVGRKYRQTMITHVKPGGVLTVEKVICRHNSGEIETLDPKKGLSSVGGSRPSSPSPSLMDLPFFKR